MQAIYNAQLAILSSIALDTDVHSIMIRSKSIPQKSFDESHWNLDEHNIESFFLYNISVFLTIKDFLMTGSKSRSPLNLIMKIIILDCDFCYEGTPSAVSLGETEDWYHRHEDPQSKPLTPFFSASLALLLANRSSLSESKQTTLKRFQAQGKRTFVKKNRAKGDEVPIEFGVEFVPIFNKYIEFRTWLLSKYLKEYLSIYGDHLFIFTQLAVLKHVALIILFI